MFAPSIRRAAVAAVVAAASACGTEFSFSRDRGRVALGERNVQEALRYCRRAVELEAGCGECWSCLGWAERERGNNEVALVAYAKAVEFSPGDAEARYAYGQLLFKRGEVEQAQAQFTACLEGEAPVDRRARVRAYCAFERGTIEMQASKLAAAARSFERATIEDAGWGQPWVDLAGAYIRLARWADAEIALRRAVELRPDDPRVYYNRGVLRLNTDKPADAVRDLEKATELRPADPEAWWHLALALARSGKRDTGLAAARRAVKEGLTNPERIEQSPEFGAARP